MSKNHPKISAIDNIDESGKQQFVHLQKMVAGKAYMIFKRNLLLHFLVHFKQIRQSRFNQKSPWFRLAQLVVENIQLIALQLGHRKYIENQIKKEPIAERKSTASKKNKHDMVCSCYGIAVGAAKINKRNVNGQHGFNNSSKSVNNHWIDTKFDATE